MSSTRPLARKRVLLACSPLKFDHLAEELEAMGAAIVPFHAIAIRPIENPALLDGAIRSLDTYDWIIFTSSHSVMFFAQRLQRLRAPVELLNGRKICALGPATANMAAQCGIPVSLVPRDFVAEGVLEALADYSGGIDKLRGEKILIPRALKAREVLPLELASAGAIVEIAPCYETVQAEVGEGTKEAVRGQPPDLAVFTSSSNVAAFSAVMGESEARRLFLIMKVAALGPITAAALEPYGKKPEILPHSNTIPSLLEAIRAHYALA